VAKKSLTADQVSAKQAKAVQFLRDVVGDDDKADQFEDMDLQEYSDHKGITIANQGETKMANGNGNSDPRTKAELLDEIDQLQQDNQDLQDQLDAIADIVTPPDDTGDDDDDADYDDEGDDDQD
jgi:hypothetical protein